MPRSSGAKRYVLPLQAVTDTYSYFSCPGTTVVNVQAFNNGLDIGFGQGGQGVPGSAIYLPTDEYLALTSFVGPRACDEIRFKNHIAGQVAEVQITCQGVGDTEAPLSGSYTPNFLTINPDGTVGAEFTGLLKALGLIIPAGTTGNPPLTNQIQWQRQSDGALVANAVATSFGGQEKLDIGAHALAFADTAVTRLLAYDETGTPRCGLFASQTQDGASAPVFAFTPAKQNVILDEAGNSSYPQNVAGNQKILFSYNGGTFTWPGGSQLSNTITFNTGFTNGPAGFVTGAQTVAGGLVFPTCDVATWTANTVVAQLWTNGSPASGTQADGWVLAWGT